VDDRDDLTALGRLRGVVARADAKGEILEQRHRLRSLRDGWRRFVIREGTVDLFEAFVELVAGALGLVVN
jgi:hypothetical protein